MRTEIYDMLESQRKGKRHDRTTSRMVLKDYIDWAIETGWITGDIEDGIEEYLKECKCEHNDLYGINIADSDDPQWANDIEYCVDCGEEVG